MAGAIIFVCEAVFFGTVCERTFNFQVSLVLPVILFTKLYYILLPVSFIVTVLIALKTTDRCWSRRGVVRLIALPLGLYAAGTAIDSMITSFYPWTRCF